MLTSVLLKTKAYPLNVMIKKTFILANKCQKLSQRGRKIMKWLFKILTKALQNMFLGSAKNK